MSQVVDKFKEIEEKEIKISIEKAILIEDSLRSNDIDSIYKAQRYLKQQEYQNARKIGSSHSKSILIDPFSANISQGYREKAFQLSFEMLRAMARTPVIKAIIATRKAQVKAFCEPQENEYSTGFIIQKKKAFRAKGSKIDPLTKEERVRTDALYKFINECGTATSSWGRDSFDVWVGKMIEDTLSMDQACTEITSDFLGRPVEFFSVDGATIRVADQLDNRYDDKQVKGEKVSHVQVYQGSIAAEFYPWELMFGVRNSSSSLRSNGYGRSELEDMIQVVTALLNADSYNANFFKVGSAPKGLLTYSGNINQNTVEEFRRQWMSDMSGVTNMHKIPIINADKMNFVNTQQSNKDMEFSSYLEFLIKIGCALFVIDPSEIGFPMSGSANSSPMFEGNNEARLKYSKDKGLKPLLKALQSWINKWLINRLDPDFEFRFVGIEQESDEQSDLDRDVIKMSNFMTINEIREKRGLDAIPGMDIIANSFAMQQKQMESQESMMQSQEQEENPFIKSLNTEVERMLSI